MQVYYCYSKGDTLCGPVFLLFFIRVLEGNQLFGNWIRFLESKLLLMKSACCFEKDFALLFFLQTSQNTTREAQLEFSIAMHREGVLLHFVKMFSCSIPF